MKIPLPMSLALLPLGLYFTVQQFLRSEGEFKILIALIMVLFAILTGIVIYITIEENRKTKRSRSEIVDE